MSAFRVFSALKTDVLRPLDRDRNNLDSRFRLRLDRRQVSVSHQRSRSQSHVRHSDPDGRADGFAAGQLEVVYLDALRVSVPRRAGRGRPTYGKGAL